MILLNFVFPNVFAQGGRQPSATDFESQL